MERDPEPIAAEELAPDGDNQGLEDGERVDVSELAARINADPIYRDALDKLA